MPHNSRGNLRGKLFFPCLLCRSGTCKHFQANQISNAFWGATRCERAAGRKERRGRCRHSSLILLQIIWIYVNILNTARGNNSFLFFSHNSWQLITRGSYSDSEQRIARGEIHLQQHNNNNTTQKSVRPFWKMASRTPDSRLGYTNCKWQMNLRLIRVAFHFVWVDNKYEVLFCTSSRIIDTLYKCNCNYYLPLKLISFYCIQFVF